MNARLIAAYTWAVCLELLEAWELDLLNRRLAETYYEATYLKHHNAP